MKDLREENAQLRATNARLAGVLERVRIVRIVDGCEECSAVRERQYELKAVEDLPPDALDDLRVIREAMDAIDCGCTDDNCWRREAYAALKERFGDNK
jgi:hypothetical protein